MFGANGTPCLAGGGCQPMSLNRHPPYLNWWLVRLTSRCGRHPLYPKPPPITGGGAQAAPPYTSVHLGLWDYAHGRCMPLHLPFRLANGTPEAPWQHSPERSSRLRPRRRLRRGEQARVSIWKHPFWVAIWKHSLTTITHLNSSGHLEAPILGDHLEALPQINNSPQFECLFGSTRSG